ncbi:MAG: hypothetical protein CVV64_05280 [Candidatus Wallbacteria bacterium HGW-Wallbacteria-1]|jgi:hypothetical protein|uniref:Uncharacterized protein n=1 Tax=Candidatus Wallbacteria bacterium HGW-Wallbacteria-1 TaxID=2013854 RepID=A0A2N1PSD1_9BACT|nr:MAG: hypothetical protein CVV64_05280 [Candidatus Wallbacteria bacterium HGW-Wallbacteria-1]
MQFLSAIAIIVLLFMAYSFMNKSAVNQNGRNHGHSSGNNPLPPQPPKEKKVPQGSSKNGAKVLDFMAYKRKKNENQ